MRDFLICILQDGPRFMKAAQLNLGGAAILLVLVAMLLGADVYAAVKGVGKVFSSIFKAVPRQGQPVSGMGRVAWDRYSWGLVALTSVSRRGQRTARTQSFADDRTDRQAHPMISASA